MNEQKYEEFSKVLRAAKAMGQAQEVAAAANRECSAAGDVYNAARKKASDAEHAVWEAENALYKVQLAFEAMDEAAAS